MAKKADLFDRFIDKNFNQPSGVKIVKPGTVERDMSFEDRKSMAEAMEGGEGKEGAAADAEVDVGPVGEAKPVKTAPSQEQAEASVVGVSGGGAPAADVREEEPRRGPGRPKREGRGEVVNMNFLIERDLKQRLEQLKLDQYRSSVTDLLKEAILDLFNKYGVSV